MARRWTLKYRAWAYHQAVVYGPALCPSEEVEVIEAPAGEPDPDLVGRVAQAIQYAYESFDLSTFTRLDERFWPEAARAAIDAYEKGEGNG